MAQVSIATAQFPVSKNIQKNLKYMLDLTQSASKSADVIHFSETSLGGYAGADFESWDNYDWGALEAAEKDIRKIAKANNIAIVCGTNKRIADGDVRNRLLYVSAKGREVAHYDKRFCTPGDLKHYRTGRSFATFKINGIKFGMLICYDVRFPELYREYKKLGVQVLLHSFYNARAAGRNIHTTIMRAALQARAATNYLYVSGNNSSGYYQSWPSVFIQPDGTIVESCKQHTAGFIINESCALTRLTRSMMPPGLSEIAP